MRGFSLAVLLVSSATGFKFNPDNDTSPFTPKVPTTYELTESQTLGGSYYVGSFLTTSDSKQYFVMSHVQTLTQQTQVRHSVLDISDPSQYWKSFVVEAAVVPKNSTKGPVQYIFEDYGFSAPTEDAVSSMQTWASTTDYSFNISFDATSTAIQNLGTGTFLWGSGLTNQWSLPACRTEGTLSIAGNALTIDPENSFTWYDRQWSSGRPSNFTWFGLRFPDSKTSLSVWAFDYGTTERRLATARTPHGDLLLTHTLHADTNNTWTSPSTNNTYPSRWTLDFQNGDHLVITAIRPDQEAGTALTAFANVEGTFLGSSGGVGVVDVIFI
ncbi:Hydroxyneurosporene synthase [Lasiodiplodia theobromae]|nr:Hydroxyneurosporene synthase [Lasiodiplodia theobromae]